ncbi:hypothetical protein, partial [Mesorhizobium sp.]|uniref:hypothetical protein n=1 Tax=Mesorhizobium sp. TaxID=1871066 RepID=UPI00257E0AFF
TKATNLARPSRLISPTRPPARGEISKILGGATGQQPSNRGSYRQKVKVSSFRHGFEHRLWVGGARSTR